MQYTSVFHYNRSECEKRVISSKAKISKIKKDKEDNQVKLDSVHLYDILGFPPLKEQIFDRENGGENGNIDCGGGQEVPWAKFASGLKQGSLKGCAMNALERDIDATKSLQTTL